MRDLSRLDGRIRGTVVVAGVGVAGRGDDAAGSMLAQRLRRAGVPAIDCGDRPEDVTGEIAQAKPDTIVIVDAVEMGAGGGDVAVFGADEALDRGCDTHNASLATLMRYLEMRTGATVLLLGIQPAAIADTPALSPAVAGALDLLEEWFVAACAASPPERESGEGDPDPAACPSAGSGHGELVEPCGRGPAPVPGHAPPP